MTVYVAVIEGRAIAAFDAQSHSEAELRVRDRVFRDDLMVLSIRGVPLWDGLGSIEVRPALPSEEMKWRSSHAKAIRLGNIETEDDAWIAYLVALSDPDRRG